MTEPSELLLQKIAIAIRLSLQVYKDAGYVKWAEGWLSGRDRCHAAAYAAASAAADDAAYAADAAAYAASAAADDAAYAAADAAYAAYAAADRWASSSIERSLRLGAKLEPTEFIIVRLTWPELLRCA